MTNDNIFFNKYQKYKKKYFMYKKKIIKGGLNILTPDRDLSQTPITIFCPNKKKNKNTKAIIKSHGHLIGKTFKIPSGINIITLSSIGNGVPLDEKLDKEILHFYMEGNHIFDKDDTSIDKSENGALLERKLNTYYGHRILFKNHIGESYVNDMLLNFEDGMPRASMNCITYDPKPDTWGEFHPSITSQSFDLPHKPTSTINNIHLSLLIKLTLGINEFDYFNNDYNITFIVIACRTLASGLSDDQITLIRNTTLNF